MSGGNTRFSQEYLGYLLGQANHALFKAFDAEVRAAGLNSLEWRMLAVLNDSGPLTVGALAQEVLSQQPTVTKGLQRLADSGWVLLGDDPADQRRTQVRITRAGQAKVRPLLVRARAHEAAALDGLGETETRQLKATLRRLAQL